MAECRGKKGKLKKMKEKYKDQDEEERQLKMQILQASHHSCYFVPVIQCCGAGAARVQLQ